MERQSRQRRALQLGGPDIRLVGLDGNGQAELAETIAGMCPGPILVNIGEGKIYALAALAGALTGAGAFGALYQRLQPLFHLPPLTVGTGEG